VLLSDSENPIGKIKSVKINNMKKRENGKKYFARALCFTKGGKGDSCGGGRKERNCSREGRGDS
jgi:hypothetical protein